LKELPMSEPENIMSSAEIEYDGSNRDGIQLYLVRTTKGEFWFEAGLEFVNDYDFWVIISTFGLIRRTAAGSTAPSNRRTFTPAEAATAQAQLEALFQGPADIPGRHYRFINPKAKCLGVRFEPSWIAINS
jgi:hypothetical protein